MESLVETLGADRSAVFTYDTGDRMLAPQAACPAGAANPNLSLTGGNESVWPTVLSDIRPVVLGPGDAQDLFPTASPGGHGVWATITVRHRVFGGVGVSTDDPDRVFSDHDRSFVASIATVIGSVFEREEFDRLKADFVSTVSHELRTPLSSVLGYVELLGSGDAGELSADQAHMVEVIARNGNRLLALVQDLLSASRIDAATMALSAAPVDVGTLLDSAVQAVSATRAGRDVRLAVEVAADLPPIDGDAEQLARVLANVLGNAVKFTPDGGSVSVRARRAGASAEIEVADTGVGIPKAEQEHLFERFFRASTARAAAIQGTGLGLSIVKSIIEAHGGTVAVESDAGAGTTVRLAVPLFAASARRPARG